MAFVMKLDLVDVVCDNSLQHTYVRDQKVGYQFQIRLSNYRGHYLSCIKELKVTVDGEAVNQDDVTFCLNGKEFTMLQLPHLISEFWNLIEPATIKIYKPGGLASGSHHIDVTLLLRIPYLRTPGSKQEHDYATLNSSGSKTLTVM